MTDSDCIVPKNWIEDITKLILERRESVVMGCEHNLINNFWTKNMQKESEKYKEAYVYDNYANILDTKNFAIESLLIKKLKFDSELENCEDFDLGIRIREIKKIRFIPEIKVGHYHKSSFKTIIKLNFNRGYWVAKIYHKNIKENKNIKEPSFEFSKIKTIILSPIWLVSLFIKNDFKKAFFLSFWNGSWVLGFLCSRLT